MTSPFLLLYEHLPGFITVETPCTINLTSNSRESGLQKINKFLEQDLQESEILDDDEENGMALKVEFKQLANFFVRKAKSGIKEKTTDDVVNKQKWPHANLKFQTTNTKAEFSSLSYVQFVAGETRTILKAGTSCVIQQHINFSAMQKKHSDMIKYLQTVKRKEIQIRK